MLLIIDGSFSYSLLLGILAAVNPCGFALLPTYLLAYLSVVDDSTTSVRVHRSLLVGGSVSAGFLVVFLVVGIISRIFTNWIEQNAKYAALVIGLVLVVLGIRMLSGWRPRLWVPALRGDSHQRGFWGMFGFGVVYAIASIGCTIGLLTTAVLGSFARDGFVAGILSVCLYGLGMGIFVTALTTTLAFAKGWLVGSARRVVRVVHHLSSALILTTGLYLSLYWYVAITQPADRNAIITTAGRWQTSIVDALANWGSINIAIVLVVMIALSWYGSRPRD